MPIAKMTYGPRPVKRPMKGPASFRGTDLLAALRDPEELDRQNPAFPKPRILIEGIRFSGKDELTARDEALYKLLLAWVAHDRGHEGEGPQGGRRGEWKKAAKLAADRGRGSRHPERSGSCRRRNAERRGLYRIPLDAVMTYLASAPRTGPRDRRAVLGCMDRLSRTHVRYNVKVAPFNKRARSTSPTAAYARTSETGEAELEFTLPPYVLGLLAEPGSWRHLELRVFPRFKSKYSARLYQRFAMIAGYSVHVLKPLEITPQDLAEEIGFAWTRFPDFKSKCLDPALDEIHQHVRSFSVFYDAVPAKTSGRGRPGIGALSFTITSLKLDVRTMAARRMSWSEANQMKAGDRVLGSHQLPSASAFSKASRLLREGAQRLDIGADELSESWRAVLDEALDGVTPVHAPVPGMVDLWGEKLLRLVEKKGADQAMLEWAERTALTGRFFKRSEDMSIERDISHLIAPARIEPTENETREQKRLRYAKDQAAMGLWGLAELLNRTDAERARRASPRTR